MKRLDSSALRAVCVDLYGRPPTAAERETWLAKDRKALVEEALSTEEAWRHWLDQQLYYFMLIDSFRPVGTSLDELPKLLSKRATSIRDAIHRIALCTSFDLRNPGSDTFVTVVMEQYCGIEVRKARRELELGKRAYDGGETVFLGSPAASQADVVRIAARHRDAARHFVAREHQRLTGEALPKRDRNRAAAKIDKAPIAAFDVLAEWFTSEAYDQRIGRGKPVSNRTWVRMVFHDLGRPAPEASELEALRSALDGLGDPAPLRSAIVRMALRGAAGVPAPKTRTKAAASAFIRANFDRLIGRDPTSDEMEAFTDVVIGDDGPESMFYVLMTSEEYERP